MPGKWTRAVALTLAIVAIATSADAQSRRRREPVKDADRPPPPLSIDKRDSMISDGAYNGRPYWYALAQCGGIYFKLNTLYADIAAQARVVKPDPKAAADYTKKLTEAIRTATAYFSGAEHFLMTDRNIERAEAVLTYDGQSRAAGDRLKTVDAVLDAAKACPAVYQACQEAYPKACSEPLSPMS